MKTNAKPGQNQHKWTKHTEKIISNPEAPEDLKVPSRLQLSGRTCIYMFQPPSLPGPPHPPGPGTPPLIPSKINENLGFQQKSIKMNENH